MKFIICLSFVCGVVSGIPIDLTEDGKNNSLTSEIFIIFSPISK